MSNKRTTTDPPTTATDTPDPNAKKGKVEVPKDYRVDVLQVPCNPKGDCSVHVLLSKTPPSTSWVIEKVVLIDGGNKATWEYIVKALALFQKRTALAITKFDAWVLTHWDGDHYEGAIEFFNQNKTFVTPQTRCYCPDFGFTWPSTPSRTNPKDPPKKSLKKLFGVTGPGDAGLEAKFTHDYSDKNNLIGLDFFTGERLFNLNDTKPFETIASKLTRPVLACFGSNGCVATTPGQSDKPVSHLVKGINGSDYTNRCSIMTLTLWPERFSSTGNKKATYYSAGDGNLDTEKILLDHLKSKGITIEALKASHHGSREQFSTDFFLHCKPDYWLVSPGTRHGHPSAQVLLKLAELMCQVPFKVYPTRMLYWYRGSNDAKKNSETDVNVQTFAAEIKAYKKDTSLDGKRNTINPICQRAYNVCVVLGSLGLFDQTPLGDRQELTVIDAPYDHLDITEEDWDTLSEKDQKALLEKNKSKLAFRPGFMATRNAKETKVTETDLDKANAASRQSITQFGEALWNILTDGVVAQTFNVILAAETKALEDELKNLPATATDQQKAAVRTKIEGFPPPAPEFPYWLHTLSSTKDTTQMITEQAGFFDH